MKRKFRKFMLLCGVPLIALLSFLIAFLHFSHTWQFLPENAELIFVGIGVFVTCMMADPSYYYEVLMIGVKEGIDNAFDNAFKKLKANNEELKRIKNLK